MKSLRDEFFLLLSGKAGKYYIAAIAVPVVIVLIFSAIFVNNQVNEGKVFVVDMDNTAYSRQLIEKMNASQYIDIQEVVHQKVNVDEVLYGDKYLAVMYLAEGLEENHYKAMPNTIGLFLDNTNTMGTANLRTAVQEVVTAENMAVSIPRVKSIGLSDDQVTGTLSNISIQQRMLYNPNSNYANTTVLGFVILYPTLFFNMTALPLMARLRMTGQIKGEIMGRSALDVASRILPYAFFMGVGLFLGLGLLKLVGGFRFAGNPLAFLIPTFLFTISTGLLAMFASWKAKHPGEAMSKMMLVVVPGFVFSGATISQAILPVWAKMIGNFFPMVWYLRFIRDMGLRGASLSDMLPEIGGFLLLTGLFLLLVILRYYQERRSMMKETALENGEPVAASGHVS